MFLKIGHRGAPGYAPENTLLSFEKALALGVDAIEFDVRLCKTGELVVIHSNIVDETTNGTGYVKDMTFDELRLLDAGQGQQIPTPAEVLDLIDKKVIVNIELKGINAAIPAYYLLRHYIQERLWPPELFMVSSFDHPELAKFHRLAPEIKIGALILGIPLDYAQFGKNLGAWSVNLSTAFINQTFVDDAHNKGLKVLAWIANELRDIEDIKKLGVDGIFSNFPDRL